MVVAAIFTTCVKTCPLVVEDLRALSARLPRLHVVLVTLTPDVDTEEVLAAYKQEHALPGSWTLLRGSESALQDVTDVLDMHTLRMDAHVFHDSKVAIVGARGELVLVGPSDELVRDPDRVAALVKVAD